MVNDELVFESAPRNIKSFNSIFDQGKVSETLKVREPVLDF